VLLALTGYETGLLVVAAVFISFALTVALVVPRSRPEFPSRRLAVFVAVCVALFAAQITAVLLLAEVGEADEPVAHEETTGTETTETETAGTETAGTETTDTEPTETAGAQGDPVAGKTVFASAGCASCHTLADSGATGAVGPNLDAASPSNDKVVERVTNGQGVMPPFKGTLTEQQIQDVAAYVSSVAGS
jgi:mono/diheme cytochrome c family protein